MDTPANSTAHVPPALKVVDRALLADLAGAAASSPRQRQNHNLHPRLQDPVQRFLNALQPGSYVRPHRHLTPLRWELFVVLSGRAAVLLVDEQGVVLERLELAAEGPAVAVEIPAGCWHTLTALAADTVLFEFKEGPYGAVSDKDFAPWAPTEGEAAAVALCQRFATAQVGEALACP